MTYNVYNLEGSPDMNGLTACARDVLQTAMYALGAKLTIGQIKDLQGCVIDCETEDSVTASVTVKYQDQSILHFTCMYDETWNLYNRDDIDSVAARLLEGLEELE